MSGKFEIQWEWLPSFEAESLDGQTFSDLKICVNDKLITELEDLHSKSLRKGMYVSAYPLALFFAANWWRLLWEPMVVKDPQWLMRHSLTGIGDGYVWPDITFASDGKFILIRSRPTQYSKTSPVRFLTDFSGWVPVKEFERMVSEYIEGVLARMLEMGFHKTELSDVWQEVCQEKKDVDTALWRRCEALAGYDPDEAPEAFVEQLLREGNRIGFASIHELAAASRSHALEDLSILQDALRNKGMVFQIAEFEKLKAKIHSLSIDTILPPWRQAYNAAKTARNLWGLDDKPISNAMLADLTKTTQKMVENATGLGSELESPYSASSWKKNQYDSHIILNRKPVTSRRFAICRLIGDRFWDKDDNGTLSAATDAATGRQKFQRAFAQELLCPFESLIDYLKTDCPNEDDIEDVADHFQVSPHLVHTTLVNHHVLPRDLVEELSD